MKIKYFQDADTLYLELKMATVTETRDLDRDRDENIVLDLDAAGRFCAITLEHASERADISQFSFEQVAAELSATRGR